METGTVQEIILLDGPSPWRRGYRISMVCAGPASFDPWLISGKCTHVNTSAQGEFVTGDQSLLRTLDELVIKLQRPMTASIPYDRQGLLAERQTDLQAKLARAEKEKRLAEKKLQAITQAPSPYPAALSPLVRSPVPSQRFLNQTPVPIQLGSAEGITSGGYMVRVERKDAKGNWVAHVTLPVGAVQAHSGTGYLGFGAGTPPGGITTPGAWRLSAQVSSPKASGWSDWVEFVVMEPVVVPGTSNQNKIMKAPTRSFGK